MLKQDKKRTYLLFFGLEGLSKELQPSLQGINGRDSFPIEILYIYFVKIFSVYNSNNKLPVKIVFDRFEPNEGHCC
jgi:hypothetical protein